MIFEKDKVKMNKRNLLIDLSPYPQGLYFLKVTDGENGFYKKVVKQ